MKDVGYMNIISIGLVILQSYAFSDIASNIKKKLKCYKNHESYQFLSHVILWSIIKLMSDIPIVMPPYIGNLDR